MRKLWKKAMVARVTVLKYWARNLSQNWWEKTNTWGNTRGLSVNIK
jgi:hypothetical protein